MKYILLLFVFLLTGSCSHHNNYTRFINSRQSFVKIEMIAYKYPCETSVGCPDTFLVASGSGVHIIAKGKKFVLTAEHVCDTTEVLLAALEAGAAINVDIYAIDLQQNRHILTTVKKEPRFDLCLLEGSTLSVPATRLSPIKPQIGEQVFNFASPVGIHGYNMVPVLDGYYSGPYRGHDSYTIPAMGGSSGSPILNRKGELVGMIHSVHSRFPYFSLSPTHESLIYFLFND